MKTKMPNKKNSCVQCGRQLWLLLAIGDGQIVEKEYLYGCNHPACPAYGFLQIGVEDMPRETTELKVKENKK